MITDEGLKELKAIVADEFECVADGDKVDITPAGKALIVLIEQEQQIRAVKDEEVQRAITQLEIMATQIIGYMATTKNELAEKQYNALDLAIAALSQMQKKDPCEWCKADYTIIDDDFGQPIHPDFITNCFHCGRPIGKDVE